MFCPDYVSGFSTAGIGIIAEKGPPCARPLAYPAHFFSPLRGPNPEQSRWRSFARKAKGAHLAAFVSCKPLFDSPLRATEQLLSCETDVSGDLPKQGGRNVSTRVEGDGCSASVRMAILSMRPPLADLRETQGLQKRRHLSWLQDGD